MNVLDMYSEDLWNQEDHAFCPVPFPVKTSITWKTRSTCTLSLSHTSMVKTSAVETKEPGPLVSVPCPVRARRRLVDYGGLDPLVPVPSSWRSCLRLVEFRGPSPLVSVPYPGEVR